MFCLNCDEKEISKPYHDAIVLRGDVCELHRDCADCGEVFVIYVSDKGFLSVKRRDGGEETQKEREREKETA